MLDSQGRRVLFRIRSIIHKFRRCREWRAWLKAQCQAAGIKFRELQLDMPVRWNSSWTMLDIFLLLEKAIRAVLLLHCHEMEKFVVDKLLLEEED
jgi:hypothetical protein